ncbi:MAG: hypothetical protein GY862_20085 [Gammaproteobacteria bacterium]|nr:hypothetical protein [Gammaproteobacteria bacterium]
MKTKRFKWPGRLLYIGIGGLLMLNAHMVNAAAGIAESVISAGIDHVCAIQLDGNLNCWGANDKSQASPPGGIFTQVSAGYYFNCALKNDGTISCWGEDTVGETSPPDDQFIQIAAGGHHACALDATGEPVCWGANEHSQSSPLPGPFKQLALGDTHSCGLTMDGNVECWGNNSQEQSSSQADIFTSIAAGYRTTCGVRAEGEAACWGRTTDSFDYLTHLSFALYGDPDGTDGEKTEARVDKGTRYTFCGLKSDNTLSCPPMASVPSGGFSYITSGGHTTSHYYFYDAYYDISGHYNAFHGFACGIRENNYIACWGENNKGRATAPVGVKFKHPGTFPLPIQEEGSYQEGFLAGQQSCKDDTVSCELHTSAEVEQARQDGVQICKDDAAFCDLHTATEVEEARQEGFREGFQEGSRACQTDSASSCDITQAYEDGREKGHSECNTDPASCDIKDLRYLTAIDVWGHSATELEQAIILGKEQGKLYCLDDPAACDIAALDKAASSVKLSGEGFYNVGDPVTVTLAETLNVHRFNRADLWVIIKLPDGQLLYMTDLPLEPFSAQSQPFMRSLESLDRIHNILDFEVPPNSGGDYAFYAFFNGEGEGLDNLYQTLDSNIAKAILTLRNE